MKNNVICSFVAIVMLSIPCGFSALGINKSNKDIDERLLEIQSSIKPDDEIPLKIRGSRLNSHKDEVHKNCSTLPQLGADEDNQTSIELRLKTDARKDNEKKAHIIQRETNQQYWPQRNPSGRKPMSNTMRSKEIFALLKANATLYTRTIASLIEQGVNHKERDLDKNTLLHTAVKSGAHEGLILLLIESKAMLNAQNKDQNTPLHAAAQHAFLNVIELLVKKGAKQGIKNKDNETAQDIAQERLSLKELYDSDEAAQESFLPVLNQLKAEQIGDKYAVMHYYLTKAGIPRSMIIIIYQYYERLLDEIPLLKNVCIISAFDTIDAFGYKSKKQDEFLEKSIKKQSLKRYIHELPNASKVSVLRYALINHKLEPIEIILESGISFETLEEQEKATLIGLIEQENNYDGRRYLEKYYNKKILNAAKSGNLKAVKEMLTWGANLNARIEYGTEYGADLLQLATENGSKELIEFLLHKGLSAELPLKKGPSTQTAYDIAKNKDYEILKTLEQAIALNKRDHNGMTALHRAAKKGDDALVQKLIRQKVNLRARDNNGRTPLHIAAKKDHSDVVYTFIMTTDRNDPLGDILHEKDLDGLTPFDVTAPKSKSRKFIVSADPCRKSQGGENAFFADIFNGTYTLVKNLEKENYPQSSSEPARRLSFLHKVKAGEITSTRTNALPPLCKSSNFMKEEDYYKDSSSSDEEGLDEEGLEDEEDSESDEEESEDGEKLGTTKG